MKLNENNYFSREAKKIYTGSSEIKEFIKCEACALAKLKGEWEEEKSKAMMVSSYIDAAISGELDFFKEQNTEIFLKNGDLKAEYKVAEDVIAQMKEDPMFMKYINGTPQVIMTGEISEVPVKIKIDSYHKDKLLVDLKAMGSLDLLWNEKTHQKENFVDFYRYTIQAALYQEICYQNTGKKLPFIIAVATKEKYSRRALLQIDQDTMDREMLFLQEFLPHLQALKEGKIEPTSCGTCNYCISKQKVDKIWYYDDFFYKED